MAEEVQQDVHADKPWLFKKGQSGNPSGRKKMDPELKSILKAAVPDAARKLVKLIDSRSERIAFMAIQEVLNRIEGKPTESVHMNVSGSLDVRSQIRSVLLERLDGHSRAESTD